MALDYNQLINGVAFWLGKNLSGSAKLVEKEEDKFNNRIRHYSLRSIDLRELVSLDLTYFEYPNGVKKSKFDESKNKKTNPKIDDENFEIQPTNSLICIKITFYDYDWWFLHRGKLQLLMDDVSLDLGSPKSRNASTTRINDEVAIYEVCTYFISVDDFAKMCKAKSVSYRLTGKSKYLENDFNQMSLDYFKSFYNQVFDKTKYNEEMARFVYLENEQKKALRVGVGVGCVIPIIIILVGVYTIDPDDFPWKTMFAFLVIGWSLSFYIKYKAKTKSKSM